MAENIGLGCDQFTFAVYIANRPNMLEYQQLSNITPLTTSEIFTIGQACGNGWRKVFNVYAKLLFALEPKVFPFTQLAPTWQKYRDDFLLQNNSQTTLLFSAPLLSPQVDKQQNTLHIICGKTHAKKLINSGKLDCQLTWLDDEFAIDRVNKLVVCPYFDYRQLSNNKIERLATLLLELKLGLS
ncbi:DUF6942 family protein [Colwellia piezophila]|uniref:DUF6942 family protein n=1 Tax=Colwellia piezophila TaxID=211668 RepID=UPI00035E5A6A|nr:hypothetical protein [Colwellia piezophila]